jgi:hypothetical protein
MDVCLSHSVLKLTSFSEDFMLQCKWIRNAAIAALAIGFIGDYAAAAPIVMDISRSAGNSNNIAGTITSGSITYNGVWTGSVANLTETDGTPTTIGFSWVDFAALQYINNIDTNTYPITSGVTDVFPLTAAASWWGAPNNPLIFKFTGLNPALQYDFTFYAGHPLGTDKTAFTLTGANVVGGSIVSGNNLSNLLSINGVTPTAGGEITVSGGAGIANQGFAINAVQINAVVPEPATLGLIGLGGLLLGRRRKA